LKLGGRWLVEDEQFRILLKKLEILSHLLAANVAKGLTFREQVKTLSSAGLAPKDIAAALGTTPNNVRVTLSTIRSKSRRAG
jgi:DNA-binding CsgD family transcriptional regulator